MNTVISTFKGIYVFCQAGNYQQLYLVDENGEIKSRDIPEVLKRVQCEAPLPAQPLPKNYNAAVMRVKKLFGDEVKRRAPERQHTYSLTLAQRYVIKALRVLYDQTNDEDAKAQVTTLERAFRGQVPTVVNREINTLRRNGVVGATLLKSVSDIFHLHRMADWARINTRATEDETVPIVVCSEALT